MPVSLSLPITSLRLQFSGEAGDGILSAGDILMRAAARTGLFSTVYKSFPPNIRGGNSLALVTVSSEPILSPIGRADILVALSRSALEYDEGDLGKSALLVVDAAEADTPFFRRRVKRLARAGVKVQTVPFTDLTRRFSGSTQVRSISATGIAARLLSLPLKPVRELMRERFSRKGPEVAGENDRALLEAYRWGEKIATHGTVGTLPAQPRRVRGRAVLEGNEAITLGALAAGCTFFSAYPITPATSIGDMMAEMLPGRDGFAYQAEDEIAALGAVIGASFSGARSMTATSGPGLSLMQEFLGYAAMIEVPVVVVDVQRAGPSTGMPTKHGQEDLFSAALGGHGESQRIILAPTSVEDSFAIMVDAFNAAERYQCPVVVLTDSSLGMIRAVVPRPDLRSVRIVRRRMLTRAIAGRHRRFMRYKDTPEGVNPMPAPGVSPVTYRATGVEHDQRSAPGYAPAIREQQVRRRFRKVEKIERENQRLVEWDLAGVARSGADISVLAWGLTASATRQAVASLRHRGYRVAALYPRLLFPLCKEAVSRLASLSSTLVIPEANFTGQFAALVRMETGIGSVPVNCSRGEPLLPEELEERILAILESRRKKR